MDLPNMSLEQAQIIENIKENNVIVESVAGSGKTTTNLFIAKTYLNLKILLLTYNSKLKIETREKINKYNISNIEVHSYHSFCVKNYDEKCFTDYEIIKIIKINKSIKKKIKYDIIILDEAQDITPLYFELICKINSDNSTKAKLCLLGDRFQSIYDFNKADPRFIIYAEQIFNLNNFFWTKTQLTTSFRITHEMAEFINNCMLNSNRIKSNNISNNKPRYIICNTFDETNKSLPLKEIIYYLELGYKPEEIFILAPSVKNFNSPVRILENLIKNNLINIPIFVPTSDEEKLDDDVLKNKLVFSTFHQSKGLERKIVIVYSFDFTYFKFYKKDKNPNICPNELYVATTRAKEHLTLIHHYYDKYLEFINIKNLNKYCNVIGKTKIIKKKIEKNNIKTEVTKITQHLPIEILNNCMQYLQIKKINTKNSFIDIPIKTKQKYGYESVSEITGVVIPSYYEYMQTNTMTIYNQLINNKEITINNNNNVDFIDSDDEEIITNHNNYNINDINLNNITTDELLFIGNKYCSYRNGFLFKLDQINNYDWLNKDNLDLCVDRLNELNISKHAKYEAYIELDNEPELFNRLIIGFVDCIDQNNVYEFKCVHKLETEHYLQLTIYMYLIETHKKKNNPEYIDNNYEYYLYNILTDEMDQIICDYYNLKIMIEYLMYSKFYNEKEISDDDFISKMKNLKNKI